ncbi:MAG: DUF1844 domain-containing protein [Verrucomicrobia bacterium]|nr:DUF1844 domain-containing protein [Verrucomicrobiota bacterium]
MNVPPLDEEGLKAASTEEIHVALFLQLVSGHAQMALLFLGELPHPDTGQPGIPDVPSGKMFIDQLEMLEVRTRGNLNAEETRVLQQALHATRQALAAVLDRQSA